MSQNYYTGKRSKYLLETLFLIFTISISSNVFSQITVSPNQTASALASKLAGKGVTILNPVLKCAGVANGIFNVASGNPGIDSGILLTTGHAATVAGFGVNGLSAYLASNDVGYPGDPMLNTLAGQTTIDACSLEFDVIPNGDTIKFSYVFSSEEYKNAVCGPYNDAFAFFISGPGIAGYENMALVPGTNIPVTINTINNGIPGAIGNIGNCTMMGTGSPFTSYYIDNSTGLTLTHQGLTTVLQAIHTVTPCGTYHLKIAIADAGDALYDSGVFLKAGSLQTSSYSIKALIPPVPLDTLPYCIKGCLPGHFKVKRSQISSRPETIRYTTGGNAVSGIDYVPLTDSVVVRANDSVAEVIINGLPTSPFGTKTLKLYVMSPYLCSGINNITDSASISIYDTLHINIATPDTLICGKDSVQLQVNGNDILTYNWSPETALSNPYVKNPIAFPSVNTTYEVTATLPGISCPIKTAEIIFTIKSTPAIELTPDTTICYNTKYQLNPTITPPSLYYGYAWSGPNGFTSTVSDPNISNANAQNSGTYSLSVINDVNNCRNSAAINLSVNVPDTPKVKSPFIICLNSTPDSLTATGSNLLWYDSISGTSSGSAPTPPTNEIAVYNYYLSQTIDHCESPKAEINVEVKKCCDGIINIPTAFTPNGDGLNDKFRAIVDYGYFIYNMSVYNRWGQIVYNGLYDGWDGNFGGKPAEIGTYFYTITFGCVQGGTVIRKGDVTLIR